MLKDKRFL